MLFNPMDMTGRKILVTGASSGIGKETSILLSRLGAQVVLVARRASALSETLGLLDGNGHRVEPFDLYSLEDIPAWMKRVSDVFGPLDGVVHSAGIQLTLPLRALTGQHIDKVMKINLHAGMMLAKGFRQKGVHVQNRGSLVFLSSVMGLVGAPTLAAYCASKGAVSVACKSLALELVQDGIRVNCVAPAIVKTEMADTAEFRLTPEQISKLHGSHPLGIGTPLDVAYSIAFLLADTGKWITGTTLIVDGGYTAQ